MGQLYNPCSPLRKLLDRDLEKIFTSLPHGKPPAQKLNTADKQVQHRLKPFEIAELVTAYKTGESAAGLAKRFGIHRTTALSILERAGVSRRYRVLTDEQTEHVIADHRAELSAIKIAKPLGVNAETVRSVLKKAGVNLRGPHERLTRN